MRVDCFLCREIPRFQNPSIIPRTGPWLNPLEDIYILRIDSNIILRAFCVNIKVRHSSVLKQIFYVLCFNYFQGGI